MPLQFSASNLHCWRSSTPPSKTWAPPFLFYFPLSSLSLSRDACAGLDGAPPLLPGRRAEQAVGRDRALESLHRGALPRAPCRTCDEATAARALEDLRRGAPPHAYAEGPPLMHERELLYVSAERSGESSPLPPRPSPGAPPVSAAHAPPAGGSAVSRAGRTAASRTSLRA
jgi:hypothetical protein